MDKVTSMKMYEGKGYLNTEYIGRAEQYTSDNHSHIVGKLMN